MAMSSSMILVDMIPVYFATLIEAVVAEVQMHQTVYIAQGHWYRPDGTQVGSFAQEIANDPTTDFFSRDRHTGVVRLNRQGNPPERGRFHCEVPNANGDVVTVYVNIGEWFKSSSTALLYM